MSAGMMLDAELLRLWWLLGNRETEEAERRLCAMLGDPMLRHDPRLMFWALALRGAELEDVRRSSPEHGRKCALDAVMSGAAPERWVDHYLAVTPAERREAQMLNEQAMCVWCLSRERVSGFVQYGTQLCDPCFSTGLPVIEKRRRMLAEGASPADLRTSHLEV